MSPWLSMEPVSATDVWPGLWFEVVNSDLPDLAVRVRLSGSGGPPQITAISVLKDGRAVGARDLRRVDIRGLAERMRTSGLNVDSHEPDVKPSRPGPIGHGMDHWRHVWQLYEEATAGGSRAYIDWMRRHWDPPVPDATMRRWVARVKQMHERGEL